MKTILTVDQAFNNENVVAVENALFDLNKNGVYDPSFLGEAKKHLTSRESTLNFTDLETPTHQKVHLQ